MLQRGRRSIEAQSVKVDGRPNPIQPPDYLTDEEADHFRHVVASVQPKHFVLSDTPLIAAYVQADLLVRELAVEVRNKRERDGRMVLQFEKAVRTLALLATKLRLAPQSRLDRVGGGRTTRTPTSFGNPLVKDDNEDEAA